MARTAPVQVVETVKTVRNAMVPEEVAFVGPVDFAVRAAPADREAKAIACLKAAKASGIWQRLALILGSSARSE